MNRVPTSSRRQLFRLLTAGAVSFPLAALADKGGGGHHCLLKGTKISTAKGECLVQDLKIGDEVHTLRGLKGTSNNDGFFVGSIAGATHR
jgi:hypothetical protein